MAELSPMMQQYLQIKEQNRDSILFFRLGDFYEMFFEDAELASKELEITLTGRDCGLSERAPMCGVPFHSADNYISKLISKGYKVAICEQVEDPALARGIVRRDVVRVITPGTVTDTAMLDEKKNNYLVSIYKHGFYYGISAVDISTGEFHTTSVIWGNTHVRLVDELAKYMPSEIIINTELHLNEDLMGKFRQRFNSFISRLDDSCFIVEAAEKKLKEHFNVNNMADLKLDGKEYSISSSGALIEYLEQTQKINLAHIKHMNIYSMEEFMALDISTRRNLELTETMREKNRKGSLLWVLDKTVTSMGGRMLRKWIEQPLLNMEDINGRLQSIAEIKENFLVRIELEDALKKVCDIERLMSKVIYGTANCRDLIALKNSIGQIPFVKGLLQDLKSPLMIALNQRIDSLTDVFELIDKSINEEPPVSVRDGELIRKGFDTDVDRLRLASTEGKNWVANIENSEREKTGIKNLKVGFNKVFGYYIEVTRSYFHLVPPAFIRKQTLANCERFITQELKEVEETILGAEQKLIELEYQIYVDVRNKIGVQVDRIKSSASGLAEVDVLRSLADVAEKNNYCMPEILEIDEIFIKDGRHPVVEKMIPDNMFVPNDTLLDRKENRLSIITGPNMAGKSTYMRQVALITLMAQLGSFVPARTARIGLVDRIFTRVGASDDLASGQSTFMVEMSEVANILDNASHKSLLILDEIGRGTSTFDGLSIAWSVVEYISCEEKIGARTLFATHYHELTELEGKIKGVKNYCISVKEKGDDIIFLRKIIRGGADGSYGIQVARLAGVPSDVIIRAKEILYELEDADISKKEIKQHRNKKPIEGQIDLFSMSTMGTKDMEIVNEIRDIDVMSLTPIDAMNFLYRLQKKAQGS